jgi:hypothetical protein
MPRARQRSESSLLARTTRFCILLLLPLACREQAPAERRAPGAARAGASAEPARIRRPAPAGAFDCAELRPAPKTENALIPETIDLVPPAAGKKVFFSKTGEFVAFDREEFLKAARCLKLPKAIRYLEEETGREQESPLMDAFQLSYVAAALLDVGRAGVRLVEESEWRKSIVRDGWAADACAGRCRAFGRMYRLSPDDSSAFLRVTDDGRDY